MMKVKGVGSPMKQDPCGTCTEMRVKRMGSATGGNTAPPSRKRRTPQHLKGQPFPGNWAVNNPRRSRATR